MVMEVKPKIQLNFKKLSEAWRMLQNKNCWQVCDDCKTEWKKLQSKFIHAKMTKDLKFICDECSKKYSNENPAS